MRNPYDQQRLRKTIRRDRWQNVILPIAQSAAVVFVVSPLIWLKLNYSLKTIEHRNTGPQITRVEAVLPSPKNTNGGYPYAGTVKIAGGTVKSFSRAPLHRGETVAVVYQKTRFVMETMHASI